MAAKKNPAEKFNAYTRVEISDGISTWVQHQFDSTVPWTEADKRAFEQYCDAGQPKYRATQLRRQLDGLGDIPQSDQRPYIQAHVARIREVLHRIWRVTQPIDNSEWKAAIAAGDTERASRAVIRMRAEGDQRTLTGDELRELSAAEQAWQKIVLLRDTIPAARAYKPFKDNQSGSGIQDVRKEIRKILETRLGGAPTPKELKALKNDQVWSDLKAKHPRGWLLVGVEKDDRRIDIDGRSEFTRWRSFCNAVSKEKKLIAKRSKS